MNNKLNKIVQNFDCRFIWFWFDIKEILWKFLWYYCKHLFTFGTLMTAENCRKENFASSCQVWSFAKKRNCSIFSCSSFLSSTWTLLILIRDVARTWKRRVLSLWNFKVTQKIFHFFLLNLPTFGLSPCKKIAGYACEKTFIIWKK